MGRAIAFGIVGFILLISLIVMLLIRNLAFHELVLGKKKDKNIMFQILRNMKSCTLEEYEALDLKPVQVTSEDGFKLKGYYLENENSTNKGIIILHGYTANHYRSAQYVNFLIEKGFNILLVDSRAHGDSEGLYATYGEKEVKDLDLWVELMKSKLGEKAIIGIHGHSMGAATVLMYPKIGEEKINFIIAESPYSTAGGIMKYQFKKVRIPAKIMYRLVNLHIRRKCGFSMEKINPVEVVKTSKIPTLFIHGTLDRTIPCEMTLDMYKCKVGIKKLLIVEGGSHINCYSLAKKKYEIEVDDFLQEIHII